MRHLTEVMSTSTDLPPEICSLICQDPIFKQHDLNSICFISHNFRRAAQRLLFFRFPCLRGASRIRAWCLSLKRRPRLAPGVESLVLLLPQQMAFHPDDFARLIQALRMCINLKELSVLSQSRRHELQDYSTVYMLDNLPFKLTKFVNDYFIQDDALRNFLDSQKTLQTLQFHSGETSPQLAVHLPCLKIFACAAQFFDRSWSLMGIQPERLRLDFENLKADVYETTILHSTFLFQSPYRFLKSVAIFLKRKPDRRQSHFSEVMLFFARKMPDINLSPDPPISIHCTSLNIRHWQSSEQVIHYAMKFSTRPVGCPLISSVIFHPSKHLFFVSLHFLIIPTSAPMLCYELRKVDAKLQ
ncbi:hypothetical protein BYT27DRAFT_6683129 [Phlegmacium glaucopus]|nr:hypothetical protein BYT27DRAFT_6683129 [Phlegmacium glaucopus]